MTSLDAILAQYEKNQKENTTRPTQPKLTDEERLQRYFSPQLPQKAPVGETGEARIRILPTKDGSSPFAEVYFHEIKVGDKFVKLYDPGMNEGKESPLNETYESLMAMGDKKSKDLAKQYRSKLFYIVKVIDRANEEHGPKFWRFKSAWKNDGPFDKIIPLFRKRGDITHPETGRDITLTMVKQESPNKIKFTAVTGVIDEDPSPLHEDEATKEAWLADDATWQNVYAKKPVEYLKGVAEGYEPKWSTNQKKWVWGADSEEGSNMNTKDAQDFLEIDEEEAETSDVLDDELPF